MKNHLKKVMPLKKAIEQYVKNSSHISIGGFTINRNPMAAVYEIIRQKIKNLHLYAHSNGTGLDELIGAGCVSKLEIAYAGNGKAAPTCIRFAKAVQNNELLFEDYSNYMMSLRFMAGAMGVPFLPTLSGFGSDIFTKWGFPKSLRKSDPKIVDNKLAVIDNPFGNWTGASKVVLVPAINPDITIIHVQKADSMGTCSIQGLTFADIEQVKASKHVVVTCEKLVTKEELRQNPDLNQIPFIHVSAVCHVPMGAYPSAVFGYYDYDSQYLRKFAIAAKTIDTFRKYQDKYIYGVKDHETFLNIIGRERIDAITANPRTGYSVNMKRD
ncbi:MAG: CoA transferase subunit A [Desulfobacula sp.]|uniref:CoA transferase subunit A n=1 Tax=Desulfobacula sp. TaxID=2593537 RepID=UPI0025BA8AD7|nr:CoA-transferase [Desulfobacula sp.]MCD4720987.1 CoA transferase subunit A [Desulfobacula sp.]